MELTEGIVSAILVWGTILFFIVDRAPWTGWRGLFQRYLSWWLKGLRILLKVMKWCLYVGFLFVAYYGSQWLSETINVLLPGLFAKILLGIAAILIGVALSFMVQMLVASIFPPAEEILTAESRKEYARVVRGLLLCICPLILVLSGGIQAQRVPKTEWLPILMPLGLIALVPFLCHIWDAIANDIARRVAKYQSTNRSS